MAEGLALAASESAATIPQISVYLLREDVKLFEEALRSTEGLEFYELDPGSGLAGALYLMPAQAKAPPWLPFLASITAQPLRPHMNQHVSAVLVIEHEERLFALTFGFGRFLLDPAAIEPDFGLKVAAGLIDPDRVNAVDTRILEATRVQVRRQASRGTTTQTMGVDIRREILRALSGRVLDRDLGTRVAGADSLALAGRFDPEAARERVAVFETAYREKHYRRRFPHLDRWQAVTERRKIDDLEQLLADAIQRDDPRLDVGVPEIIDWRAAGFRFSRESADALHAFPEFDDYRATLSHLPSIDDLRRDRLWLVTGDIETAATAWSVYRALEWEIEYRDDVYVLADGRWWMIDSDYLGGIDTRLEGINRDPLEAPDADTREWEVDYNQRLADYRPGRALLDRRLAYFEDENGRVEFCDVLTPESQFVHVKPAEASSALSHLFAQGSVSADLFRHSPEFRKKLRTTLSDHPGLLGLVPDEKPKPGSFEVVFALLSDRSEDVPKSLPVFSRVHLARMADVIERLDYRLRVVGIQRRAGARPEELGETTGERRARERRHAEAAAPLAT